MPPRFSFGRRWWRRNFCPGVPRRVQEEPGIRRTIGAGLRPSAVVRRAPTAFPAQYRFVEHNRRVRQKLEDWQTRLRRHDLGDLEEALFTFYAQRLENISSRDELHQYVGDAERAEGLFAKESDLVGDRDLSVDTTVFPESVRLGDVCRDPHVCVRARGGVGRRDGAFAVGSGEVGFGGERGLGGAEFRGIW